MSLTNKNILYISSFGDNIGAQSHIDHIACFAELSRHNFWYHNFIYKVDPGVDFSMFDAVIIGHNFWPAALSEKQRELFRRLDCPKIQILQDEWQYIGEFNTLLEEMGVTAVLSCASEGDLNKFYSPSVMKSLRLVRSVLPGYVPTRLMNYKYFSNSKRNIDIGYRSRVSPYFMGNLGHEKATVATEMEKFAANNGFTCNISVREKDRIYGNAWISFLQSTKFQLGSPSGSSVVDFDGSIIEELCQFRNENPHSSFPDVRHILEPYEGKLKIDTISPRVFEYTACGAVMLMTTGHYGGYLEPWKHYIPIENDYSNLGDLVEVLRDESLWSVMRTNAYKDLIENDNFSYNCFVQLVDETIETLTPKLMKTRRFAPLEISKFTDEVKTRCRQRIFFKKRGMEIDAIDWKTKFFKIMSGTGFLNINKKFESWLIKTTFGYDTFYQELQVLLRLLMAFPVTRYVLFNNLKKSDGVTINNFKDDLLLLAYIKLLHSEFVTDGPNYEIVPVFSEENNFLYFDVVERLADGTRSIVGVDEFVVKAIESRPINDFRIDLTTVFPLSIFETTVNATFKVGSKFVTKASESDEYFYLLSLNNSMNKNPKWTIQFLKWFLSPTNDRDLGLLKSLFRTS